MGRNRKKAGSGAGAVAQSISTTPWDFDNNASGVGGLTKQLPDGRQVTVAPYLGGKERGDADYYDYSPNRFDVTIGGQTETITIDGNVRDDDYEYNWDRIGEAVNQYLSGESAAPAAPAAAPLVPINQLIRDMRQSGMSEPYVQRLIEFGQDIDINSAIRDFTRDQNEEYLAERRAAGQIPQGMNPVSAINRLLDGLRNATNDQDRVNAANKIIDLMTAGNDGAYQFEPLPMRQIGTTMRDLAYAYTQLAIVQRAINQPAIVTATPTIADQRSAAQNEYYRWQEQWLKSKIDAAEASIANQFFRPVL